MQAKRQHQILVVGSRYRDGKVIIDTFFQVVFYRKAMRSRQINLDCWTTSVDSALEKACTDMRFLLEFARAHS